MTKADLFSVGLRLIGAWTLVGIGDGVGFLFTPGLEVVTASRYLVGLFIRAAIGLILFIFADQIAKRLYR